MDGGHCGQVGEDAEPAGHLFNFPADTCQLSFHLENFLELARGFGQQREQPFLLLFLVLDPGLQVVELFADLAPTNVNSFIFLAEDGWYDGQAFFHVEPGFVAQSGDPTNIGWGIPFPGYYCGDEISPDLTFDEAGMLALFTPSPGRNSSQFFITYAPQPDFNGRYTIIGRIVEGMDVAESLTPTQPGPDQPAPDVIEMIVIEEG